MTTSLGVVGVGLTAGAANAASPGATAADGTIAKLVTTPGPANVAPGGTVHLDASTSIIGGSVTPTPTMYKFHCDATDTVAPTPVGTAGDKADCLYPTAGSFVASVDVDSGHVTGVVADGKSTATLPVQVAAAVAAPTAVITGKKTAPLTVTADLTGSGIDSAAPGAVASYVVDWGDGTAATPDTTTYSSITPAPTHKYAAAGTYTLKLTVTDGLGHTATNSSAAIPVDATQPAVKRGAGEDRYLTGIAVSNHHWANKNVTNDPNGRVQANAVVLATGNAFPDALAGVPLAKKANGPLLLTDGKASTVDYRVLAEIERALPTANTTVFVLGGASAVSTGISDQLTGLGYNVVRLSGSDRFGTALAIAQDPRAMNNPDSVLVARGDEGANQNGFADALAGGSYAANILNGGNKAIVLSNGTSFDPATKAYVAGKLVNGKLNVVAAGGPAVTAMRTIPAASSAVGGNFTYAAGSDRYETAKILASYFSTNAPVGVAYGLKFPDALTGGAYMASMGGPLLLTDTNATSPFTTGRIAAVATTTPEIDVFGGTAVVSNTVLNAIAAQVHQTVIGTF